MAQLLETILFLNRLGLNGAVSGIIFTRNQGEIARWRIILAVPYQEYIQSK